MPADPHPLDVVFVAGAGRSGTTLLDLMLGQVPGFFSCGELAYVWDRSFREDQLCGCGERFHACPFWTEVADRAFGGFDRLDLDAIGHLTARVHRNRWLAGRVLAAQDGRALLAYSPYVSRLLRAIRAVSGCEVLVDSTKEPFQGAVLRSTGARVHIVHLVRDARAVAWSWQRRKVRTEIHWKREEMEVYPPRRAALHWDKRLLQVEALRLLGAPMQTLRYEDLVSDPAASLRLVLERLGRPRADLPFVDGHQVTLGVNHTVSGNPMRFSRGAITVAGDTEWQEKMDPGHRALVTVLGLPWLVRHRYRP